MPEQTDPATSLATPAALRRAGPVARLREQWRAASLRPVGLWIAATAAFVIASLWCGIWYHLHMVRTSDLEEAEHTAVNLARAFEEQLYRTIKGIDQALLHVRAAYAAAPRSFDFEAAMRTDEALSELAIGMSMIDRDGHILWSSTGTPPDLYVGDREYFRQHEGNGPDQLYISRPIQSRTTGRLTIQLTRRVTMPDGTFGGVAMVSLDPGYLTNFYNSIEIGPGGTIAVIGTDGIVRADANRGPLQIGRDVQQSSTMRARAVSPNGVTWAVSPFDGVTRLIAYRTLKSLPLVVTVAMPQTDVLRRYQSQKLAVLTAGGLVTAVLVGLILLLLRQVALQAQVEAQLRQAKDEAVAASLSKNEFLANVSHELRTPLNAVIGFSEVMRDALMGPIDNRYREYAQDIHDSGQHLLRLIGDVLDLSKIDAGRLDLTEEPVQLGELIRTCHRLVADRARHAGVAIEIRLAPALPVVMADSLRLKQILLNLLTNAVKFTREGGRVTIEAAPLPDGGVQIAVADTGIGMTEKEIAVALEPFRQVDNPLSRRYEGTGLGLPLARKLIELHGGRLAIDSVPSQGTVVRVQLPPHRTLSRVDLASEARSARNRSLAGADRE